MLSFISKIFGKQKNETLGTKAQQNTTPSHLRLKEMEVDVPRYPPFMKGLPKQEPAKLLISQSELLEKIEWESKLDKPAFQEHYIGPITRFTEFVHLLPASNGHHHRGAGGLLRHSLEVGFSCQRYANFVILQDIINNPEKKREVKPQWLLTAFLAGLFHDVGKPITDVAVRNMDASKIWAPNNKSLWEWLSDDDVDAYFLDWQENRAKQHIAYCGAFASELITKKTMNWISGSYGKLQTWLLESLNGTPSNNNPLYDILIKSDQESVEFDLKSMGVAMAGYDLGVPVEGVLIDIMRTFVRSGSWTVNKPGARVWKIDDCVYLTWPHCGEDIGREVNNRDIPGVPRNADSILDMLTERNLGFLNQENELYVVYPDELTQKSKFIMLNCIRLKDDTLVSTLPLANVAGKILTKDAVTSLKEEQKLSKLQATQAQAEPAAPSQATAQAQAEPAAPSQATAQAQAEPAAPSQATAQAQAEPAAPSQATAQAQAQAQVEPGKKPRRKSVEEKIKPATLSGSGGEIIKALADDINSGVKNKNILLIKDQLIYLVWPDSFKDYGFAASEIIKEFSSKEWFLKNDDGNNLHVFNNKKYVCLSASLSMTFITLMNENDGSKQQGDEVKTEEGITVIQEQGNSLNEQSRPQKTKKAGNPKLKKEPKPEAEPQNAIVEDVIGLLTKYAKNKNIKAKDGVVSIMKNTVFDELDEESIKKIEFAASITNRVKLSYRSIQFTEGAEYPGVQGRGDANKELQE